MAIYPIKAGTLAYYDSTSGLVPIRVTEVKQDEFGLRISSVATASCGPWSRGRALPDTRAIRIVPRSAVQHRKYSTRILSYQWVA